MTDRTTYESDEDEEISLTMQCQYVYPDGVQCEEETLEREDFCAEHLEASITALGTRG